MYRPRMVLCRPSLIVLLVLGGLTGCATLFSSKTKHVVVDSNPRGAVVYRGTTPIGQTPMSLSLDKDDDATIVVAALGAEYECSYESKFASRWILLSVPFLFVPFFIDLALQEGNELYRHDQDAFGVAGGFRTGGNAWRDEPAADSDRCFANFGRLIATGLLPAPPPGQLPGQQAPPATSPAAQAVTAFAQKIFPHRPDHDMLAYARRGTWFAILVHGGLAAPTGMAGGGFELGYGRRFSGEVGLGEDFLLTDEDGPEISFMLRARGFAVGERWFGISGGMSKTYGLMTRYEDRVDDPRWVAGDVFMEQPFTPYGVVRFGLGMKRMVGFDSCMSGEGDTSCPDDPTTLYLDIAAGFQL